MHGHAHTCLSDIETSSRCRLYKEIKINYDMEWYLKCNVKRDIRTCFTKLRLCSHRFMIERGRWVKPKIEYSERLCNLCNDRDIQDEYHIILKCDNFNTLRKKFIDKYYYNKPSMFKFQQLMSTKGRKLFRLMICIKLIMKEYNALL